MVSDAQHNYRDSWARQQAEWEFWNWDRIKPTLEILQQTILSHVKNRELRNLIKNFEKMYIYIEGKEPVARKSKSLAEMGVKDGDNLIVTTEMKLPYNVYSDDDDPDGPSMPPFGQVPDDTGLPGPGMPINVTPQGPGG